LITRRGFLRLIGGSFFALLSTAAYAVGIALIVLGLLAPWHPSLIPGLHGPSMPMGM